MTNKLQQLREDAILWERVAKNVTRERDEARQWARLYKRRYLHVKSAIAKNRYASWRLLPDDDPDWIPF